MADVDELRHGTVPALPDASRYIRLLDLNLNLDEAGRINAELNTVHLDHFDFPYIALSYCWGSPGETATIRVASYLIKVSKNLDMALHWLRLHEFGRRRTISNPHMHFWIDQICIKQDDPEEKAAQVALMSKIFTKASRVAVWLGEPTNDSDLAIYFLSRLARVDGKDGRVIPFPSLNSMFTQAWHVAAVKSSASKNFIKASRREWIALASLLQRPWFTRMWIIQEVCFGIEVTMYCGKSSLDWDDFVVGVERADLGSPETMKQVAQQTSNIVSINAVRFRVSDSLSEEWRGRIHQVTEEINEPNGRPRVRRSRVSISGRCGRSESFAMTYTTGDTTTVINTERQMWSDTYGVTEKVTTTRTLNDPNTTVRWRINLELPLLNLLDYFEESQATDPRDKVYAVFGLSRECWLPAPSYTLSVKKCYIDVSKRMMLSKSTLDLFRWARPPEDENQFKLPSWCPDWSRKSRGVFPYQDPWGEQIGSRQTRYGLLTDQEKGAVAIRVEFNATNGSLIDDEVRFLTLEGSDSQAYIAHGINFGKIEELGCKFEQSKSSLWMQKILANWEEVARLHVQDEYVTGYPLSHAYCQTLISGVAPFPDSAHRHFQDFQRAQALLMKVAAARYELPSKLAPMLAKVAKVAPILRLIPSIQALLHDQSMLGFNPVVKARSVNTRIFRTEAGYIGLAPSWTNVGDEIMLLCGASKPIILRAVGKRNLSSKGVTECWQLIGECYVHGIMDGEAWAKATMGAYQEFPII